MVNSGASKMVTKQFTENARMQHGNLANRLAAILSAGVAGEDLSIADHAEAPGAGRNLALQMDTRKNPSRLRP